MNLGKKLGEREGFRKKLPSLSLHFGYLVWRDESPGDDEETKRGLQRTKFMGEIDT
jgi:hypothetical protein